MGIGRRQALRAAGLVLLTITAYLPALAAGFVWDDDTYVTANPTLRSVAGLRAIWLGILDGPEAIRCPSTTRSRTRATGSSTISGVRGARHRIT